MQISLIIPAGGASARFFKGLGKKQVAKNKVPSSKLFFDLGGVPLLAHSLNVFDQIPQIKEVILPVPKGSESAVRALAREHLKKKVLIVRGGKTRAESVFNGLKKVSARNAWVMVHDGARPFIEKKTIQKLINSVGKYDGAIVARKVIPTIKEVKHSSKILKTIDRSSLCEAETPQVVKKSYLKKAYQNKKVALAATDEASLIEQSGGKVRVVLHESWNPKITTAKDYELACAYRDKQKGSAGLQVTGLGKDLHRLVQGRKLYVGGLHIPYERGALGHSDGDVLLHAIIDACLGAVGAGDIGDWFSDKNPKHKGIRSEKMLRAVMQEMQKQKIIVEHIDSVVSLERPKLGAYKQKIVRNIEKIMKLPKGSVSVKAKTAEGLGDIGSGTAISCEAIVTLRKFKIKNYKASKL